jgi:hypothetical protein
MMPQSSGNGQPESVARGSVWQSQVCPCRTLRCLECPDTHDDVFKGDGHGKGDVVHVFVFQRKPGLRVEPAASGHDAVPREGEHVKAWLRHQRGQIKGLYPAWFESLPAPKAAAEKGPAER